MPSAGFEPAIPTGPSGLQTLRLRPHGHRDLLTNSMVFEYSQKPEQSTLACLIKVYVHSVLKYAFMHAHSYL
jgi:hypothetical protein